MDEECVKWRDGRKEVKRGTTEINAGEWVEEKGESLLERRVKEGKMD